ncbi:MAG: NADH-quinone oxidoreductase subunit NuoE [Verrucomicrobia bacterium]|nr:NADH-quinone oxidoreductase subunit NuoE [Verrucomicrobiota bacterium]MCG2678458.1 NADH-quinone oxidoreductase subunit NuoE [Kiritimatiellia bacterium]MBU4248061.1 NADH-quinone oxidoreductase subunit NuoE [Verrucomicrobiota bacterium]MBU4290217.1 NADH-quinone oxidoreductase subunit NuoE [Verrucomicrobiota bacterium]MBU4430226.1 NADH-quinone oxidoreductase subunit NuoE [Verrucomicrobiota bacterium]
MSADTTREQYPFTDGPPPCGAHNRPAIDLTKTEAIIERTGKSRDLCIKILQELQAVYGYLPAEALHYVTEHTAISRRQIYGVATFYDQFRFTPVGRHLIRVCHGTACHVNGANRISQAVEDALRIKNKETTENGLFTLETVACLGCCSLAPAMMIDDTTYGRLTPDEARKILNKFSAEQKIYNAP